jgi:hypothetical protein
MLAEPEPAAGSSGPGGTVSWLEFAAGPETAVRVVMTAPAGTPAGLAEPPWPTPAECYLAQLSAATSASISTDGTTVELDVVKIVAVVADALLRVGALPPRMIAPCFQVRAVDDTGAEHEGVRGSSS